jgi:phosphatidylinositol-3-phosphatase
MNPRSSTRRSGPTRRPRPSRLLAVGVAVIALVAACADAGRIQSVAPASAAATTAGPAVPPASAPPVTSAAPPASASSAPGFTPAGVATPSPSISPNPTLALAAAAVPHFKHVYLIVMENREYGSIVGSAKAPYINSLIHRYALATNFRAVSHPSEPNYIALFSGSTQGVTDDGVHNVAGRNLADQLGPHGVSWHVLAENVPLGCYTGATASGGPDGSGTYARKHEPAISFTSISSKPTRCAKISDFSHFSPSAARFELIVPNMCHSMHDCSTATGDAWLRSFVPKLLKSPAMKGSVLFITWDEGTTGLGGGGHIATLVIGPTVKRGYRSSIRHTHYSLLRTIETAFGVGCLNRSCSANTLREFFR